jgi:hypothetical protein
MKKIKTVFKIDRETNQATNQVMPGAEWVINGEGTATMKIDGSACMVKDGVLYKRWDRKLKSEFMKKLRAVGSDFQVTEDMFNVLPENAIPCQEKPDPVTYHHPHWVEVDKNKPDDVFHAKALESVQGTLEDGTYELIGPKVNNNPHQLTEYKLVKHGTQLLNVPDRSFEGIKSFLEELNGEGIVFYHSTKDEMFKIRRKDFDLDHSKVIVPEGQMPYKPNVDTRNMNQKKKFKR